MSLTSKQAGERIAVAGEVLLWRYLWRMPRAFVIFRRADLVALRR